MATYVGLYALQHLSLQADLSLHLLGKQVFFRGQRRGALFGVPQQRL